MRYTDPNGMHENEPQKKGKSGGFEFVKGGYGEMIEVGNTGYHGGETFKYVGGGEEGNPIVWVGINYAKGENGNPDGPVNMYVEYADGSTEDIGTYYVGSGGVSGGGGSIGTSGGGANIWDYISNGAGVASGYPTIRGTWAYNNSGGDVRWTGKNGNYYRLSQVKNNGGYVRSMKYAINASQLTRGIGNGLPGLSVVTNIVSTSIAVADGRDITSTWIGFGVAVGGAAITVFGAHVWVTGAAIGGAAYGVGQIFFGDEINGWIDRNAGFEGGILRQLGIRDE